MKERPIIFSGAMVRAILDGDKSQTRRLVFPRPRPELAFVQSHPKGGWAFTDTDIEVTYGDHGKRCPYGEPGDRLWVRETWIPGRGLASVVSRDVLMAPAGSALAPGILFKADGAVLPLGLRWRPSIYMPRWASRITLDVIDRYPARLQDISEADAQAEGTSLPEFPGLWDSINGKRAPWASNPWVWVVMFGMVRK